MTSLQIHALFTMDVVNADTIQGLILQVYPNVSAVNLTWSIWLNNKAIGVSTCKADDCLWIYVGNPNVIHFSAHGPAQEVLLRLFHLGNTNMLPVCKCGFT